MNAVQGVDQPRAIYWEIIHEYYHLHKEFDNDRNCNCLAHRWGIILEMVNKFRGWYGHVQRRAQSGTTEYCKLVTCSKTRKRNHSLCCIVGIS
ncbi:hypothetical protein PVAP13_3NG183544 [Panicum virgatum]|uniref:Uncharacterized protein n=1 Tax=Panicum virgatum TaxID=38727 RepID=A0A8T0TZW9_PANVG|nr:hypothetical protein PVAP13_3NG183544 [Panicum virgatum]